MVTELVNQNSFLRTQSGKQWKVAFFQFYWLPCFCNNSTRMEFFFIIKPLKLESCGVQLHYMGWEHFEGKGLETIFKKKIIEKEINN